VSELDARQRRGLEALLDVLIPPQGDHPGAGELGLGAGLVGEHPELAPLVADGLAALDGAADGGDFAGLPLEARTPLVQRVAEASPALVPSLLFHAYAAYYAHPRVLAALGLSPRPPHPEGYPLEAGDLSLTEAVRARGPIYRAVPE